MSIVKIRLQKVRLNFHRRNGPDDVSRVNSGNIPTRCGLGTYDNLVFLFVLK